jgi:hypothetical protein
MAIPILGDIVKEVFGGVKDIVSEVVVDKDKRNEINFKLKELEDRADARYHDEVLAQVEVNKVEASSGSLFVAGWRPAVGWVGAAGLAYSAIIQPVASWVARVAGHYAGTFPSINDDLLLYILGGMLGLGGLRTIEKIKGVSTNDLTDVPGRTQPGSSTSVEVTPAGQVTVDQQGPTAVTAPVPTPVKKKRKFHL